MLHDSDLDESHTVSTRDASNATRDRTMARWSSCPSMSIRRDVPAHPFANAEIVRVGNDGPLEIMLRDLHLAGKWTDPPAAGLLGRGDCYGNGHLRPRMECARRRRGLAVPLARLRLLFSRVTGEKFKFSAMERCDAKGKRLSEMGTGSLAKFGLYDQTSRRTRTRCCTSSRVCSRPRATLAVS
jgi:hypothetical protein